MAIAMVSFSDKVTFISYSIMVLATFITEDNVSVQTEVSKNQHVFFFLSKFTDP
jgi:hypothetical protein